MARPLVFGNGSVTVGLDKYALIRNYCYPYVGKEDHVKGHHHRIGFWVDGDVRWLHEDQGWKGSPKYRKDTLVGDSVFVNPDLGIEVTLVDAVHYEKNIYFRKIIVKNLKNKKRKVKLFLNQHFHIAGDNVGDTAFYEPYNKCIVSYKGHRYFLINGCHGKEGISQYATGAADEGDKIGTWVDGNDGSLSGNPIEHGSVDSTIGFDFDVAPNGSETVHYWICTGKKMGEVRRLNDFVIQKTADKLIEDTARYWNKWVNRPKFDFYGLDDAIVDLFKRSLLIVRTHTNSNGAIMAAIDSDIMDKKQDTYNYMWPRDGALISRSLDKSGYTEMTDEFFEFCAEMVSNEGYLFHKYLPDKSVGSSWHPWIHEGQIQLPIQEDETALVLDALWKKFKRYKNEKLVGSLYPTFIKKAADFLVSYRDQTTKLPKPTYDLWEEKLGIHTFTCCTVYAGLMAAHNLANSFRKRKDAVTYLNAANEVKEAILTHLYNPKTKIFVKRLYWENGQLKKDNTIDISTAYGLFEFNVLDIDDPRMEDTMNKTMSELYSQGKTGGVLRYKNDYYFRTREDSDGNPWFIATLWLAEYHIAKARTFEDLKPAIDIFNWVVKNSFESGALSEQLNPDTGEPLSVSPLTWSHAGFIIAIIKYLDKLKKLGVCKKPI